MERISPQEIAAGVLGADAQPRTVTTPSGGKVDLRWEMQVRSKTVGADGRIYLLLEAEYDRANPAGLVTEHNSWHIAAVDGRKVISLFHSGEKPGLSATFKEIYSISPQPDGSVYLQIFTSNGKILGRVVGGRFKVLWDSGARYVDDAGQPCTLIESGRPILAHNSRFIMALRNSKNYAPYEQGLPVAVFILALSYDTGMGSYVQKDTELAHALCLMAAKLGSVDAQNALDRLSKQWRKNAVASGMEAIGRAQDDAAYRYRKKMRDWQEQQAGRYPR